MEALRLALEAQRQPLQTPNLDSAAQLLRDLLALWTHPGVSDAQRRELVREVFQEVRLNGREITAVMPRPTYAPLFAYALGGKCCGWRIFKWTWTEATHNNPAIRHSSARR